MEGHRQSTGPGLGGPRAPAFLTDLKENAPPSRPCSAPGPLGPGLRPPCRSLPGELITRRRAGLPSPVSPHLDLLDKPLWERPAGGQRAMGGPWAGSLLPPGGPQPGGPLPSNVSALPVAGTVSARQNCGLVGATLSLTLRWFAGSITTSTSLPKI